MLYHWAILNMSATCNIFSLVLVINNAVIFCRKLKIRQSFVLYYTLRMWIKKERSLLYKKKEGGGKKL